MKYLIIDGDGILFRCVAGMGASEAVYDGTYAGGYLAMLRSLCKLVDESHPDHTIIAWDSGRPKFRLDTFPGYKQHRDPHDNLRQIVSACRKVAIQCLSDWPVSQVSVPGAEADDLAGVACRALRNTDHKVDLVSSDKDWLQMLSWFNNPTQCRLYDLAHKVWMNKQEFRWMLGFELEKYLAYKALTGDHSDNVPGVPGIGKKRALTVLKDLPGAVPGWLDSPDWFVPEVLEWPVGRKDKWCQRLAQQENAGTLRRNAVLFDLYECRADDPPRCREVVESALQQEPVASDLYHAELMLVNMGVDWQDWGCLTVLGDTGPWAPYAGKAGWNVEDAIDKAKQMEQSWRWK